MSAADAAGTPPADEAEQLVSRAAQILKAMQPVGLGEVRYGAANRPPLAALDTGPEPEAIEIEKAGNAAPSVIARDTSAQSNVLPSNDDVHTIFTMAGALFPPYDPEVLVTLLEHSNCLRPNVDAYAVNIDGHGYRLEPKIDLSHGDAAEQIGDAIFLGRLNAQQQAGIGAPQAEYPTDDEILAKRTEIAALMRLERARLENFFDHCCADLSLTELRQRTRIDLENEGNAYWEVLRNARGEVTQFVYVPGYSVRLMPIEHRHHEYEVKQRISLLEYEPVVLRRRFRRFVQVVLDRVVHFKEFGDTRVVSRKSGQQYPSAEQLAAHDETDGPATELIHFKVHSPRSPYGIPRWIGVLLAVLGSRASEEVNFLYFDNKAVPPLAVLVSGGKLAKASVDKLESYIRDNIRGKENFHRIIILEAEPSGPAAAGEGGITRETGRVRIMLQPLKDAQQTDAQFQTYDERNIDKVGMAFRLPRLLRGDIRDFNRACYSADTETLTEGGWKLHREIGPDEKIAAFDPATGAVVFRVPEAKHVYDVDDEPMVRLRNDHTDCLVTGEHTMLVRPISSHGRDERPWETQHTAAAIPYRRFDVRMAADRWDGPEGPQGFDLPKADGCKIERGHKHDRAVAFDDWLEFLGYFVSEGGLLTTDHPAAPYLVYLDQKKPGTREKIRACLDRLGWAYSTQEKACGTTHFLLSNRCLRDWLAANCGTHAQDKRVPWAYLGLCTRQLRILFVALMAGDGSPDRRENRTSAYYSSTSTVLAGQVQRIAIQLGQRASVGLHYEENERQSACWRVLLSQHRTTELRAVASERTPASIERMRYTGEVFCYSVPGFGYFVTRRNGKIAIQGNTADAALQFAEVQVFQPERKRFDDFVNRHVLTDRGIRFWEFVSLSPVNRDPAQVVTLTDMLAKDGTLTPNEARELAGEAFNKEYKRIEEAWGDMPFPLTVAGLSPIDALGGTAPQGTGKPAPGSPAAAGAPAAAPATIDAVSQQLVALRAALKRASGEAFTRSWKNAIAEAHGGVLTVKVTKAQMAEWVVPDEPGA